MRRRCVDCSRYRGAGMGTGLIATGQNHFLARAQEKAATAEVKIDNFSFGPEVLTVAVGTTVTWTNRDDIPHTVVSTDDPKSFKSKYSIRTRSSPSPSAKRETYAYFCSIHPKMTGKVIVK